MTPLSGRTILITRAEGQGGELSRALEAMGALILEAPLIGLEPPEDWSPVDRALSRPGDYQVVVFTSANTARRLAGRMRDLGIEPAALRACRLVAIGPATAAAAREAFGGAVEEVGAAFRAEGLVELLASGTSLRGCRVLLPRAEVAREVLPGSLAAMGARVDVVTVYRTVRRPLTDEIRSRLLEGAFDAIALTSSSAVESLAASLHGERVPDRTVVAVLGPVTADTARAHGIEPGIVAPRATARDLAEALAAHWS